MKNLAQLNKGEKSKVVKLLESDVTPMLMEMGIIEGKPIELAFAAPLGDPIAIKLDQSILSIRKQDAINIVVE